ncbi:AGE family epimerase/isomerase [Streptosporangium sandarakinum]|uniref:Mannose/cellobiose epimerase-like protein (N-acyl-D-glucosamine 2-epimerase family) n=1 Tax=Streptosporangium sandarakinum TaxID=1260955 RepID=A0A852V0D8_9ACTN|nr:AGE family epimerase/isomerase [Streptosporangium sandarakinum]NYF41416.1 mannose/cellobiose epimerase-like protein (N-acyl-D-glucosamine 2-epimerase family) [Streptosporangium sandarakinum]
MASDVGFRFSDLIAGRVTTPLDAKGTFGLTTADGREFDVTVDDTTSAEVLRNLEHPYLDAADHRDDMIRPGQDLFAYGVHAPQDRGWEFDAKRLVFVGRRPGEYRFEEPDWWIHQLDRIAAFYRRAQFGAGPVDYRDYRTVLRLDGRKTSSHVQETDTISRLVYGMASAYMLTGKDGYLDVAERGVDYLREHMRFADPMHDVTYWYHGIEVQEDRPEKKLFTSEFSDDYDAIPMYEQIYALAGPTQTYRVNGDPAILRDAEGTIRLFENHFRDTKGGGYFSHIDPIFMDPRHPSIAPNDARKNWNSVGDHAPAYLINLYLATGREEYADFLERTFDTIAEHFPEDDYSPFVQERFNEDWSPDRGHTWQQDRAVVGHNLKIAWNLMRMNSLRAKKDYRELAERIARRMPEVGSDQQRGGWYDVVERTKPAGDRWYRFAWHDRKAWWQQEQAILAYLILAGVTGDREFLQEARRASAFYNAFFLDHDEGAVYFNVLADGMPYLLGTERFKGSHSMSMYHSSELCYLATVYTNLLVEKEPLNLWFKPMPGAFPDRTLRVAPDLLPQGSIRIESVEVDGSPYHRFDAEELQVDLPDTQDRLPVRVTLSPVSEK